MISFFSLLLTMVFSYGSFAEDYRVYDLQDSWQQIFPGGETTCARGTPFSFFYRHGSDEDLVIDFVGGGACWNYATCQQDPMFVDRVDYVRKRITENVPQGIYDHANDKNPLKNYSHVVIPYCTGDLHWGDAVATYTKGQGSVTIHHKGAVNAKSVIDWILPRFDPKRLFVTGTSAGGFASIFWLPYIKERAPHAATMQFSDGAAGIVVKEAYQEALANWQALENAPTWIPNLDPTKISWGDLTMVDLYTEIGRYYPTVMLSQFNTNLDPVQMLFYYLMDGQDTEEWPVKALDYMKRTSQNIENFRYFFGAGEQHTIINEDLLYTFSTNNVKLIDWLETLLDEANTGNVVCAECDAVGTERSSFMNASL